MGRDLNGGRDDLPRISFPDSASGIALCCTGVGAANFSLVMACRMRASRPSSANVALEALTFLPSGAGSGTSFSFNLRFIFYAVL